ncbi:acyl carrier protein [Kribbella sp. CA-247076]|uniref:acyl carrier protein n=1 Tax=Kribbella sp. CA-247076 TaxID=3239941 RepID=UPI003D9492EB
MTSTPPPPGRDDIITWLAGLGERPPGAERIDSMELAWLVHQVEQRYGVELADDQLERMTTVDDAVAVLAEVLTSHV